MLWVNRWYQVVPQEAVGSISSWTDTHAAELMYEQAAGGCTPIIHITTTALPAPTKSCLLGRTRARPQQPVQQQRFTREEQAFGLVAHTWNFCLMPSTCCCLGSGGVPVPNGDGGRCPAPGPAAAAAAPEPPGSLLLLPDAAAYAPPHSECPASTGSGGGLTKNPPGWPLGCCCCWSPA